ncbi:MAG TPA: NAD(P)/FAD-dependent oxidoreductase [Ilumatobacter sp.]|nr:NAD(P)/FAD-dependent oxidoreductase [Ilumatobacter sp.]
MSQLHTDPSNALASAGAERDTETTVDVVIVGTGFSGIGVGVALARAGCPDVVLLERADDIGGTWRDNTYPGAACDIQSHLYSYSFRPNPNWSRVYAPQAEILEYLRSTAVSEGLLPQIRFGADLRQARWDDADQRWSIDTTNGRFRSRILVSAAGHLSDPAVPDIRGLAEFAGDVFHSARWNHSLNLDGARIGVIGTGASAIQIVPELAARAAHLTVFQRSAPYIVPRRDHAYSEAERRMFERCPETTQRLRDEYFWANEGRFPQRRGIPAFVHQIKSVALAHLAEQVTDPVLRHKLTPDYEIGCKRILISNDFYPCLTRDDVTLETDPIERVDRTGVITRSGARIDLDALVLATGFEATDLPITHVVRGRGDQLLSDVWSDGGRAHACTAVAGFPNLFVMLGPNTGLGAGSMIFIVETQAEYIRQAVEYILSSDSVIEPDETAQRSYVATIDTRAEATVWLRGGCSSWYLHPDSGRLTTLWPDFMTQFRAENGTFDPSGYVVHPIDPPTRPARSADLPPGPRARSEASPPVVEG